MKKTSRSNAFWSNRYLIACFFLILGILTLTYYGKGIFPFADRTLLRVDLYHQYAPYLEEMRSRILSGKSLLYSWEGGLGKDFVAQMAYYTTSPLNLLCFLLPDEKYLPDLVTLLVMLKISLSGTSFAWYLKDRARSTGIPLLIFSLLYAFCAFLTCYYWNIMWLDTVALFPLVAAGVERLIEGRCGLYYLTLTLTMIVNFYLAVLVCILISLYFLLQLWVRADTLKTRGLSHPLLSRLWHFGLLSILSALTSLFILWPVGRALTQTAVSSSFLPDFEVYTNSYQLVSAHFLGARPVVLARNEDLPNVYCGVLTMVLFPLYFTHPQVQRKKKIGYSLLLLFCLLCSCIAPLDYLIHGAHFPANLPHRYTFVYSFLLLTMGHEVFTHLQKARLLSGLVGCLLYFSAILVSEKVLVPRIEDLDRVLTDQEILINLALFGAYLVLLFLLRRWQGKAATLPSLKRKILGRLPLPGAGQLLPLFLFALVLFECGYTSFHNLEATGDRTAYIQYMDDTREMIKTLDELENGEFYRTEFRRFTSINDASLYHYNGVSQFSSLQKGALAALMQSIGVAATGNSFRYYDPTPLTDALLGLSYVMNKDGPHPKAEKYEFVAQIGKIWAYRVKRSLPLGFLTSSSLKDWDVTQPNPFQVQNDFLRLSTGIEKKPFLSLAPTTWGFQNLTCIGPEQEEVCFDYTLPQPGNLDLEPEVNVVYTAPKDLSLFLYVDAPNAQRFLYQNDTVNEDRELSAGRSMIDVGHMSKGETLSVTFKLTRRGAFEKSYRSFGSVSLYAALYRDDAFQAGYDILSSQTMTLESFSDTRLVGKVNASKDCLLYTSIPYDECWEVTLDNKKTEKVSIGDDGLLGVEIPEGEHTLIFTYRLSVLIPAVALSLLGLLLSLFLLLHGVLNDPVEPAKI